MGQRLVFKCIKDGKQFATLYYHWSGFTLEIYRQAAYIIEKLREKGYNKDMSTNETRLMLLDILREDRYHVTFGGRDEWEHGGVSSSDLEAFKEIGASSEQLNMNEVNRNQGLIDITESGMANAIYWADVEPCDINFDSETFQNWTLAMYDKDDYIFTEAYDKEELDRIYSLLSEFNPPKEYVGYILWDNAEKSYEWFKGVYEAHEVMRDKPSWILGFDANKNFIWVQTS